jgi:hypothetical protein
VNDFIHEDHRQFGNSTLPENFDNSTNDWFEYFSDFDKLPPLSPPASIQATTDDWGHLLNAEAPHQAASASAADQGLQTCVAWSDIMYSERPLQPSNPTPQASHPQFDMLPIPNPQVSPAELVDSGIAASSSHSSDGPATFVCYQCPNRPTFHQRHLYK